jgi:hypothetical protein
MYRGTAEEAALVRNALLANGMKLGLLLRGVGGNEESLRQDAMSWCGWWKVEGAWWFSICVLTWQRMLRRTVYSLCGLCHCLHSAVHSF